MGSDNTASNQPFRKALDYLDGLVNRERLTRFGADAYELKLDNFAAFEDDRERPYENFECFVVAGTKGKGSTAVLLEGLLRGAGKKVGLYTSPHLLTVRERIQVNRQFISEESFAEVVSEVRELSEQWEARGNHPLSYFESLTAVAFQYFVREKVDCAVLEIGLGGRLDAVNAVTPRLGIITSISMDHMNILGDTLEKIASQKGGIIKESATVFSAPQKPEARRALEKIAADKHARLYFVEETPELCRTIPCPLPGSFQNENYALAARAFLELGLPFDTERMRRVLAGVNWSGRFQILQSSPTLLIDGAHNGDSMEKLLSAVKQHFTFDRLIAIFGTLSDKDYPEMLKKLCPLADTLILTEPKSPRALTLKDAESAARIIGVRDLHCEAKVDSALELARKLASSKSLILVCGSLYLVSNVLEAFTPEDGRTNE